MLRKIILSLSLLFVLPIAQANAELRVDITKGTVEPMPIAVTSFHALAAEDAHYANQIPQVIAANLESSGLFKPLNPNSFVQDNASMNDAGPRFGEWRAIGTQALVSGAVTKADDGRARVEFRLWDVYGQQQLIGMAYMTNEDNWRRIAHIISDEIYTRLTGEEGYFDTRIVYIAESGPPTRRMKRLAIMDQDGYNHKYLTDGADLVLTPRFSPTEQEITYMSYGPKGPRVYLYNINTGRHELLGDFPGMTFSPRFSPDGKKVIMSMAKDGNSDIYEMTLSNRRVRRVTDSSAIETAPSYAPDGKKIVFESDRGGSQQLYTMNADGSNAQRITFGDGRYANPVWSPRGDLIAFTRMYKGKFYIGVIRPDGSGERLITTAYHVEGPSWSPNGRVLTYFKERAVGPGGTQRQAKVYTVDITGYNERWLRTPQDGSDPAWSPLNP
ncbi:MAG: Tol-Pal system beta propeller repeat protein TolB [Micavibrio sp.]|nr:Tol-Pal system beta propeller repeat protein TolB [Micavibrio sp.]|tara:strand:+ start:1037 stop:2362 length:1326 start_codon:yes stop_codon:yes gene_type:complete